MATIEEHIIRITQQVAGASAANGAMVKIEEQIRSEMRALQGLEEQRTRAGKRLKELQGGFGGVVNIGAVRAQQVLYDSLQEKIAARQGNLGKLDDARGIAAQLDAQKASTREAKLQKQATKESAEAEKEAAGAAKKSAEASAASASAATKVLAVVLATVAALLAAAAAFTLFAIRAADAARSSRLLNEAAAGGTVAGSDLSQVIADVANKVPLARDKIAEMARALELAKFEGRQMQIVLQAMGTIAAAVGDGAAGKIQQIAESSRAARRFLLGARDIYGEFTALAGTGLKSADIYAALASSMKVSIAQAKALLLSGRVSVKQGIEALDAAVETRFGKTVAAQMLAITTQVTRLRENISLIFTGLDLEPLLLGLKSVTELFSQSTVTGRALRKIAETVLQPIIDGVASAAPLVRAFMQGLIIGTLIVVVAVLKLRRAYLDAFGGETANKIDWVKTAMYAGVGAVGALTAVVLVLSAAIGVLAAGALLLAAPFLLFWFGIYLVISNILALKDALEAIDLGDAANNIADSFIAGIRARIASVVAAVKEFGQAGVDAFHAVWKIFSPSRIALDAAHNVTGTFAGGVEDGAPQAQAAFKGMVGAGSGVGSGPGAGGGTTYHFDLRGSSFGAGTDEGSVRAMLRRALDAISREAPEPQAT